MFLLGVLALTGLAVAAVKLAGPNVDHIATGIGLPAAYVQSARKWSTLYRVPLEWVLATILVESGGKPNARGDADGRSVGLMQVNVIAHAAEMAQAGVSASQMTIPDVNIQWGTKYLKQFKDDVETALGGRQPPIPLDWIVRLAYKGPATVESVLRKGGNPATISWAPEALRRWSAAMTRILAAEGKAVG